MTQARAMDRRTFGKTLLAGGAVTLAGLSGLPAMARAFAKKPAVEEITLPPLPYPMNALEPVISERTVSFHYGKHHAGYVKKANGFIKGTPFENMDLTEIIRASASQGNAAVFNNAAQVANHTFYWNSMKPGGGGAPKGDLKAAVERDFGSVENLKTILAKAAGGQFGSGWAWLALDRGKLTVLKTANADTPLAHGMTPLLTIDVWEHAYYLDYQNRRGDYIQGWLDKLVNWDFAEENFNQARS